MAKFILAGVGYVDMYSDGYDEYLGTAKTLTENSLGFTVTEEEIRGGKGNSLIGSYFHDSGLTVSMTDALFSIDSLALNIGGTITVGANVVTIEQQTAGANGVVTVNHSPNEFLEGRGYICFIKKSTDSDEAWKKFTFNTDSRTVNTTFSENDVVCVRYCMTNESARKFSVSTAFIPQQISIILTLPLYRAGTEKATAFTASSQVGEMQVKIPKFLFSGAQDLSLTSSGAATTALSGKALATDTGIGGCSSDTYYGEIIEVVFNKDEFEDVQNIVIVNSNLEMSAGDTKTLEVRAMYNGATAPKVIDNSKITFTVADSSIASVSSAGVVTANATGTTTIEAVVTSKTSLTSAAVVEVTA